MANFYATYSPSSPSSSTVTALQGTDPWVVTGDGVAGTPSAGVLTIQGDPAGEPIPISGSITATNPSVAPTGATVPAEATLIGGSDGTDLVAVKVSASGVVSVDGSAVTQPISAVSLPLPTGAATEATLQTVDTSLSSIDTKTPALGQALMAASVPVAIASDQSAVPVSQSGSWGVAITDPLPAGGNVIGSVSQSGTWTVQPGNTANTTPWLTTISEGGNAASVTALNALKVDGSAVTQPVSLASTVNVDQISNTTATIQEGSLTSGSITGTYATVMTAGGTIKNISGRNNTNAVIEISFDNGSTTGMTLDPGDAFSFDLKPLGRQFSQNTQFQIRHNGVAPTSGSIRLNGIY